MIQEARISELQRMVASERVETDRWVYHLLKRCLDVIAAASLLVLLSPVILLIAVLIKLDTPGPVIFKQERVGARRRSIGGAPNWEVDHFKMYKFRSMVHNADQSAHQAYINAFAEGRIGQSKSGAKFKMAKDHRVTGVGQLLRRTSLDELPQLVNVLRGEMSLVGPRPVPAYEVAKYQDWHYERLAALPGMTGFWQVRGRSQVTFDAMITMDIEYVRSRSLWLDLAILLMTIPAVLSGRGAQ